MKTPQLRKRADGYYRAAWTDDDGKPRQKSFGKNRTKANARFSAWLLKWRADAGTRNPDAAGPVSVGQAVAMFAKHADGYYRHADGTPTREADNIAAATAYLDDFADMPAEGLSPSMLREAMARMSRDGLSVNTINARARRVRQVWKWLAGEQVVPAETWAALTAVPPAKPGRAMEHDGELYTPATNTPVGPVDASVVWATCEHLTPTVAAIVAFQYWTACRPAEACRLRMSEVDTSDTRGVWLYRPKAHKTSHRGRDRTVIVGPNAQDAARPYIGHDLGAYLFTPAGSERERHEKARELFDPGDQPDYRGWPCYQEKKAKREPKRFNPFYSTQAYGYAIRRAAAKANVPHWSPNQLRHAAATRLRKEFGLDVAQAVLGHASADTTEIYAGLDMDRAAIVMSRRDVG